MNAFVLHPEAYADLDEIWEYIATDNLPAADRILEEIYQAIQSLAAFPYAGHTCPDLTLRGPYAFNRSGLCDCLRSR
jgi:plasmid stabilization system protein ParE